MYKKLLILLVIFFNSAYASEEDCGAFFIKNGVVANFPILRKRNTWEWYKKIRPEYVWMAETGSYVNGEFNGNGFGLALNIGAADLKSNPVKKGSIDDLVKFASKNAFLTKESIYFLDSEKKEKIQFKTVVMAKIVDNQSIGAGVVDPEAVKMAKINNPTHMKLTAILPKKEESYTCFPEIEVIK